MDLQLRWWWGGTFNKQQTREQEPVSNPIQHSRREKKTEGKMKGQERERKKKGEQERQPDPETECQQRAGGQSGRDKQIVEGKNMRTE